jgi:hypothetical protein
MDLDLVEELPGAKAQGKSNRKTGRVSIAAAGQL